MTRPYVDVTVVEFAAHTAFLDPVTGIGYLVLPPAGSDIEALSDPLVEAAWSERRHCRSASVAARIPPSARLEQKPGTALGLVNPDFDEAGAGDVPVPVA